MKISVPHLACAVATVLIALALAGSSAAAGFQDENLLVGLPPGFQIGAQGHQPPAITIAEYVPQGESVKNWTRMITVQVLHDLKNVDPNQFAESIETQWLASCSGSEVHKIKNGQENGYTFSLWLFACPLNVRTGKPENMWGKFIGGNDSFYSIQYAYRSELTREVIAPTMTYLGAVRVCDSRLPDRPCPTVTP